MGYNFKRGKNKYKAVRTNGMSSKLEAAVYQILLLREKAGEIKDIKKQQSVDLGFKISWKVDFSFIEIESGRLVYAEAKGFKTDRYRMCLKLWEGGQCPNKLEVWEGSYKSPKLSKVINKLDD